MKARGKVGTGGTPLAITIVKATLAKQAFASVPRIVNGDVPAVVGVPASPPAAVRVTPAGSAPAVTPKLYGAVPPLPAIVWL
jgi:hypothetical protein